MDLDLVGKDSKNWIRHIFRIGKSLKEINVVDPFFSGFGSDFNLNFYSDPDLGSGLIMKNTFELQII